MTKQDDIKRLANLFIGVVKVKGDDRQVLMSRIQEFGAKLGDAYEEQDLIVIIDEAKALAKKTLLGAT